MKKIKSIVQNIDSVDIVLTVAFGLYMILLVSNLLKMI